MAAEKFLNRPPADALQFLVKYIVQEGLSHHELSFILKSVDTPPELIQGILRFLSQWLHELEDRHALPLEGKDLGILTNFLPAH